MPDRLTLWLLLIAGGFLSGSILYSRILPLLLTGKDVSAESDDHNPGAANAFMTCGFAIGMLCLLLDIGKGLLPVLLSRRFLDPANPFFALLIIAPVLGHAIAPFNHFRGGKCIATSFGVLLGLLPQCLAVVALAILYILFSTIIRVRPHRRRSILVFALFGAITVPLLLYAGKLSYALGCAGIAMTVIWRHLRVPAEVPAPVPAPQDAAEQPESPEPDSEEATRD